MNPSTWVWLGRAGFIVHAFAGLERGALERLAGSAGWRRGAGTERRLARCGAHVRCSDELTVEAGGRRCRSCERGLAGGGEPWWMTRARSDEYLVGAMPPREVRVDDAGDAFDLAERIARDVARELLAADAPDYVREAMRSAAAGAALMVAERIGQAARQSSRPAVIELDAWRAERARGARA